jgi:hypothetical protein
MVNPYYLFFYFFYRLFDPIAKEKDRLPFGISAIMGLILIIHGFITLSIIENIYTLNMILPKMNKIVFSAIIFILYFSLNHFLFERNDRYTMVVQKIANSDQSKKIIASTIIILYLLFPFILKWVNNLMG